MAHMKLNVISVLLLVLIDCHLMPCLRDRRAVYRGQNYYWQRSYDLNRLRFDRLYGKRVPPFPFYRARAYSDPTDRSSVYNPTSWEYFGPNSITSEGRPISRIGPISGSGASGTSVAGGSDMGTAGGGSRGVTAGPVFGARLPPSSPLLPPAITPVTPSLVTESPAVTYRPTISDFYASRYGSGRVSPTVYPTVASRRSDYDPYGYYRPYSWARDRELTAAYARQSHAGIPGIGNVDYPRYSDVPYTGFSCQQYSTPGYYADVSAGCQVFHVCEPDGRQHSFLCPNGTLYHQKVQTCDWWYNVDCPTASSAYFLNSRIGSLPPQAATLSRFKK